MICSLVRLSLSARLDDGREPGPRARRHLERCQGCRAYRARLGALDGALRQQAATAPRPALRPRPAGPRLVTAGVATAALAVAAYFAVASALPSAGPAERQLASAPRAADDSLALPQLWQLGQAELTAPLESELAALGADSRRGLRAILDISGLD